MIADKRFKSYFAIELEGSACNSIIAEKFSVKRVTMISHIFDSDIEAVAASEDVIEMVLRYCVMGEQEVATNPEFFPGEELEQQELDEELDEELKAIIDDGKVPVVVTTNFDNLGDFVQLRTIVTGDDYRITSKIIADPPQYLEEKTAEKHKELNFIAEPHRELYNAELRIH